MRKIFVSTLFLACLFAFTASNKTPNILIIGDSISIGYMPFVKKYFQDDAIIIHNKGNAQHTGTGLEKVEEWLGTEKWDIIQFNWGLWDLCYRHPDSQIQGKRDKINGELTLDVDQYAANLDSIVSLIQKKSKAKLIFVTTTYVPETEPGRFAQDAIKYNDAAKEVMEKHGVLVNDIYEVSEVIHQEHGAAPNNVHYTSDGYAALGEVISIFLKDQISILKN